MKYGTHLGLDKTQIHGYGETMAAAWAVDVFIRIKLVDGYFIWEETWTQRKKCECERWRTPTATKDSKKAIAKKKTKRKTIRSAMISNEMQNLCSFIVPFYINTAIRRQISLRAHVIERKYFQKSLNPDCMTVGTHTQTQPQFLLTLVRFEGRRYLVIPKNNNNNNTNDVAVKRINLSQYHMTEDQTIAKLLFMFLSDIRRVPGILICHGMANGLWLCMPFAVYLFIWHEHWLSEIGVCDVAMLWGSVMNTTPQQRR